ncbi:unnamed protein product [marine sediment metagenome]|uniref:SWIM-type domain-containing protein n=1 Tax=marine sediment metagenome TaxID=412755 RepID=X1DB26_9ZZZZ
MIYKIGLTSTSDYKNYYTIKIDTEIQTVECSCIGCVIHGYCKHIKFYKRLIKKLLHENPGFEREKHGL